MQAWKAASPASRVLRVYVAGGIKEKDSVAKVYIEHLRKYGVEITHDWTVHEAPGDHNLTVEMRAKYAAADLDGVAAADLVWVLLPEYRGGSGHLVEYGYALALGKCTVVSGEWTRTIFSDLATHKFFTHDAALGKIFDIAHNVEEV